MRTVQIRNPTYENAIAECPHCEHLCVFNRVSDLKTKAAISGMEVTCCKCGEPFWINGDRINAKHELLIFDSYQLGARKEYIAGVLTLAQSYEVFFSAYLNAELLLKPNAFEPDIDRLNALALELFCKSRKYTFHPLRCLFLHRVLNETTPSSWDEAAKAVARLPDCPKHIPEPSDRDIDAFSDPKIGALLMKVKKTSINTIRNKAVHQLAYRPTRDEFDTALEDARATLPPLASLLDINDDANHYLFPLKN